MSKMSYCILEVVSLHEAENRKQQRTLRKISPKQKIAEIGANILAGLIASNLAAVNST